MLLTSGILPRIRYLHQALGSTDLASYGMIVYYGSKNFIDEFASLTLRAEALCLIASKGNCQRFVRGEITETDFLNKSHIFISDRNMVSGEGFKKITVQTQ